MRFSFAAASSRNRWIRASGRTACLRVISCGSFALRGVRCLQLLDLGADLFQPFLCPDEPLGGADTVLLQRGDSRSPLGGCLPPFGLGGGNVCGSTCRCSARALLLDLRCERAQALELADDVHVTCVLGLVSDRLLELLDLPVQLLEAFGARPRFFRRCRPVSVLGLAFDSSRSPMPCPNARPDPSTRSCSWTMLWFACFSSVLSSTSPRRPGRFPLRAGTPIRAGRRGRERGPPTVGCG